MLRAAVALVCLALLLAGCAQRGACAARYPTQIACEPPVCWAGQRGETCCYQADGAVACLGGQQ